MSNNVNLQKPAQKHEGGSKPLLVAEHIDKQFGITHAVNDVSLTIDAGEVRGLIGENGSGKSTFSQMLCGIYSIGGGSFTLDGQPLHPKNQVEANNAGVAIIVQEMGTLSGLTVAENIFFGHEEPFMHLGVKNTGAMNREAQRLLNEYGFGRIKASDMIDRYNFEDRKLVEIVKATYMKPKILVVDETTTALSQNGRQELYKIVDAIRADGRTVIFISHDLNEVMEHTDSISVLRDGEFVGTFRTADTSEDQLKRYMVGREIGSAYYRADYGEKVSDEAIAYTSKNRDNESVIVNESIRNNIVLPSIEDLANHGILNNRKLTAFADKYAKDMQTKMTGVNQFVSDLSGGNKQKVVLARWLGKGSDILVLDSPTRGIDIGVKQAIYALMDDMRKQGKSIIMISEEIPELLGMADRIIVMKDGTISGEFMRDPALSEEDLIAKMV